MDPGGGGPPAVSLTFTAVDEPQPGARFRAAFARDWPHYRGWYLRDGEQARPRYGDARRMLRTHMPELEPTWERMVKLAGGGDLSARFLTLYDPPALVPACSQAVYDCGTGPLLVRNYDFHPQRLEGVIRATELTGRRVIGMSDCLWGLLDGMNEDGLAVSLTFGGDPRSGHGFAITIVVRYLLETCATVAEAAETVGRLPIQAPYNLTLLDRSGHRRTLFVGPDRPAQQARFVAATNHQASVSWVEHATATRTVERQDRLLGLLGDPAVDEAAFVEAFLHPPLRSADFEHGFATLYTAVHRPAEGSVEYRWPGLAWPQSIDRFEEGCRTVTLRR